MAELPHLYVVLPTFNEEGELRICLDSLAEQEGVRITTIVANAGEPLSPDIAARVVEVKLDSSCFWAASTQAGFDKALELGAELVMQGNADNQFIPGSIARQLEAYAKDPDAVYGSPGYIREPDGRLRLQYSRDMVLPFFLHNYLKRDWTYVENAPDGLSVTDMAGQGVLFKADHLQTFRLRPDLFPMYRGDHTFWLKMRKAGVKLYIVNKSGIINQRPLSAGVWAKGVSLKRIWWYLTSPYSPDSTVAMWRYRVENLGQPAAFFSFWLTVPTTWLYRLAKAGVVKVKSLGSASRA